MTSAPKITELEGLRALPVPRPDEVCQKFALRIEPSVGFLAFGVVWLVITAPLLLGVFFAIDGMTIAGADRVTAGLRLGFAGVLYASSMWMYVVWCRRKRRRAAALVRDGVFVDATVVDWAAEGGLQFAAALATGGSATKPTWARLAFVHGGARYHVRCPFAHDVGSTAPVLFVPDYKHSLAFDSSERASVGRVHVNAA